VTVDVLAGVVSTLVIAVFWLARQVAKTQERVARLEGRMNGRPPHDR
jgi:MFS superfamily sulfate permease-like transporter